MLKFLKKMVQTGEATVQYPFAPHPMFDDARGKPQHTRDKCIACAACAVACPPNAITFDTDTVIGDRTWNIDYGRCIFCGRCEEVCPTRAITLSQEFELAVFKKEDLLETAHFNLQLCSQCGEYFAASKEVAYVRELLMASMGDPQEIKDGLDNLSICPDCKRMMDAQHKASIASKDTGIQTHLGVNDNG